MIGSPPAASHRLHRGSFPALEPRFFREIARLQQGDPLRPIDVVVTSNLLGVHLRRRYLEWREGEGLPGAHAAISFRTLEALAAELAGPGLRPLPQFGEFALLSDALARLPESRVFGALAVRPDFVPSLEATIRDLADAGVTPKDFRAFVESSSLASERKILLGGVARMYEALEKGAAGFEPAWRLLRRAGAARQPAPGPLLLYGFYDATGVQREFLEALARHRPILAFVPRPPGRWGDFAEPFLDWAVSILATRPEDEPEPDSPLNRICHRFGDPAASEAPESNGALRLVSAATASGERTELAREIMIAAEAGVPLHRMGVIVRNAGDWSTALSHELTRLGIPNFEVGGRSAADSLVGRAARIWWGLEERRFPREDVLALLELLADAPGRESLPTARNLVRQAGIVRGDVAWRAGLEALASRSTPGPKAAAALALIDPCERIVQSAASWPDGARPWNFWALEILRRLEVLYAPSRIPEPLRAATETLAALGALGGDVERMTVAHVFFAALERQTERSGRLGLDGVMIAGVMAARGLTFGTTLVANLVEKEFPALGRPDPLFFDEERSSLAAKTRRPVPLKVAPRGAEERLLFGTALGSATQRLVLTSARRDEALTRDSLPSPFFAEVERATELPGSESPLRKTALGSPTTFGPPVSDLEAFERTLQQAGAATVASVSPAVERALLREELARARRWTSYEGRLGASARSALERHRPGSLESLSASSIGNFAACAYKYFLKRIQGLREWEELGRAAELDPLALGTTFHDAARFVVDSKTPWPVPEDAAAEVAAAASEWALAKQELKIGPLAPPLVREIARGRVVDLVRAWLKFEAGRDDGLRPAAAEKIIGKDDVPLVVDAGPFSVRFAGAIDRVDEDRERRPARVVDYKVKTATGFPKAFDGGGRILGGEACQLPVYAMAVGRDVASEYLVLRNTGVGSSSVESVGFSVGETRESIEILLKFLRGMDAAVASGAFVPRTATRLQKTPCSFCEFADVCGPGHIDRFVAKEADPDPAARAVRDLWDLP